MRALREKLIRISIGLALASAILITGCTSAPPSFQEGPDAEITFDGLVRIDNTQFKHVWADPDADLSGYTKIVPIRATVEFRAVKPVSRTGAARSSTSEFPIDEKTQQKIVDTVSEIFSEEIAQNNRFAISDKAGPDTLIVAGSLLDIVSHVPPEPIGRGDIFISSVGEITLVLELKDSQSGETLVRAVERRALEPAGNRGMRSNAATNQNELRRLARRWGARLREGLDSL